MIKIMIADDNYQDIFLTREVMKDLGINNPIFEAYDGEQALNIIENNNIGLVLLDIKMPKLSGIEVLKKIKQSYPHIIVVMLTTSDMDKDIVESYNEHADAYIVKPFEGDEFEKIVNNIKHIFLDMHFEFIKYKKK